jgi:hypothetical protein
MGTDTRTRVSLWQNLKYLASSLQLRSRQRLEGKWGSLNGGLESTEVNFIKHRRKGDLCWIVVEHLTALSNLAKIFRCMV